MLTIACGAGGLAGLTAEGALVILGVVAVGLLVFVGACVFVAWRILAALISTWDSAPFDALPRPTRDGRFPPIHDHALFHQHLERGRQARRERAPTGTSTR